MTGENTPEKSPRHSNLMPPWQPGQSGNPNGRPKGARSKLAEDFCAALLKDFENNGEAAIKTMREEKAGDYVRAIASIIPKEFDGTITGELSPEMKKWLGLA